MKKTRTAAALALMAGSILLTACGMSGPFPGVPELHSPSRSRPNETPKQVAPPRVVYRIDENRFFEIVHHTAQPCANGTIYYIDKDKGIRSSVVNWDKYGAGFIIDAANDQYLIGPVTRGNTDCSSGGGGCGGSRMPYSTDAGRTWKRGEVFGPSDDMSLSGSIVYASPDARRTRSANLAKGSPDLRDWTPSERKNIPHLRTAPVDTKFHCTENGKE